ncbi:MAG: lamin tail domain-containing protein [Bacteroidia bacterium]|nr:lamin tail domain-containing protein [Bacteroidia bacterium]
MRWAWILGGLLIAQVTDDFSDGDFTTNPTWSGTDAYWIITPDFRLRSNGPSASATLYLSTTNTLMHNTEWQFWVRVGFNPSPSNFVRVYLVADRADLTDPALQGYYLRLGGILGNLDSLELYRQQGSLHTRLAGGKVGRFGGTNNILRIRVLRNAAGTWSVYTDSLGFWEQELVVNDAFFTSTSHFGILFQHTSTNRQNLWLDDFYIGPPIVDTIPPQILSAEAITPTLIRLTFSEAVEAASAQNLANYTLSPGGIVVNAAVRITPAKVELTLSAPLTPSVVYQLSFTGIQDMNGNSGSGQVNIVLPELPQRGDLVMSELMAKPTPAVGLPPHEYVEIYNRSSKWLTTTGLRLCDEVQCGTLRDTILPPQTFILLVPNSAVSAYSNAIPLSAWPTLNDSGDSLTLLSPSDEVIEALRYRASWYRDPLKAQGGWSLERIDLDDLCSTDSNWIASTHPTGGTPGASNSVMGLWTDQSPPILQSWEWLSPTQFQLIFSEGLDTLFMQNPSNYTVAGGLAITGLRTGLQTVILSFSSTPQVGLSYTLTCTAKDCKGNSQSLTIPFGLPEPALPGDVIFSEIMAKPTPMVGLPPHEYVEIHNRSSKWISLGGWQFCDGSRCALLPERVLGPGDYLVLTTVNGASALPQAVGLSSFPTLNDSGDSLVLLRADNVPMDQVQYYASWYRDPAKAQGGWSLERIDLDDLCSTDSNWIASIHLAGGTPGAPNSVMGSWSDQTPPSLVKLTFRSLQEILLTFSEPVDTAYMRLPQRYILTGGTTVQSVSFGMLNEVLLYLTVPLISGVAHTLDIEARDCAGNAAQIRYAFGLPAPAAPFDVVISEVMADPDPPVGLPPYEYIELYNRSQKYIELENWTLQVGTIQRRLPHYLLPPNSYVTVTSSEGVLALSAYGPALGILSFPSLPNRGGLIVLRDAGGRDIERLNYSDAWYKDPAKEDGGWSLERLWTEWLCAGGDGWRASASPTGGTPASLNSVRSTEPRPRPAILSAQYRPPVVLLSFSERMDSSTLSQVELYRWDPPVPLIAATPMEGGFAVELLPMIPLEENRSYTITLYSLLSCAGEPLDSLVVSFIVPASVEPMDVVINEILPEPQVSGVRYVELYNRSEKIIDATQLILARGGQPFSFRAITGERPVLLFPRGYLCVASDTADVQRRYSPPPHARFHQVRSLPAYDYSRDTVWLLRSRDSVPIDWVPYSSAYHFPDLRSRKGVALERLSPHRPSHDPQNWYSAASSVRYGTPGYENSQREPSDAGRGIRLEPRTISPDGDGYDDILWIYVPADSPDTKVDIEIYTLSGHLVSKVAESYLLGVGENTFRWEGVDKEGRRLAAGVYVVSISLIEPNRGKARQHRLLCAVAEKVR